MIRMSDRARGEICAVSGLTSVVRDPGAEVARAVDRERDVVPTSMGS